MDEMSRFVSSKSGIIESAYLCNDQESLIGFPKARSLHQKRILGLGFDVDMTTAMIKSLAEALERYVLIYARANGSFLYKKSMKELQSMGYTGFYSEHDIYEDFVYKNNPYLKKMSPDLKTDWTACKSFSDDKTVWLPASYMHSHNQNLWSHIFKKPSTNGMACSFFSSAIEDAVLELIERDTFMYMWLGKKPGEEVILDEISFEPLNKLIYTIGYRMKQIKIIYKYTDTQIPCLFVVFKGKKKYNEPVFCISGNADTNIERGCYRALLEFTAIYNSYEYRRLNIQKIRNTKNFVIKNFTERTAYYTMPENFNKCAFLFETIGKKRLSDLSAKWNTKNKKKLLKKNLKNKNIFFKDMTPKEIEKTKVRIIRSYSPDLLDLDCEEDLPFNFLFKKKRIDIVDKFLNTKTNFINRDPHCYP